MDIEDLKKRILIYTGMDLNSYNSNMLKRRLRSLLAKMGMTTIDEYWELIRKDYSELRHFLDYITINVTQFNRDPVKFQHLQEEILPIILQNNPQPRIWSCACSSGEEPYSIAIMLEELSVDKSAKILATDIDSVAIKAATEGVYSESSVENLSNDIINKYFQRDGERYKIKDNIKERVNIKYFNLISDNYKRNYYDLIVCRNVIIHFAREVKDSLYKNFNSALKTGGFLFLGGSEKILIPETYGFKYCKHEIYQKTKDIIVGANPVGANLSVRPS